MITLLDKAGKCPCCHSTAKGVGHDSTTFVTRPGYSDCNLLRSMHASSATKLQRPFSCQRAATPRPKAIAARPHTIATAKVDRQVSGRVVEQGSERGRHAGSRDWSPWPALLGCEGVVMMPSVKPPRSPRRE
eukprot:scaffold13883_cov37-Tisochrysis_lutea.AAC.1